MTERAAILRPDNGGDRQASECSPAAGDAAAGEPPFHTTHLDEPLCTWIDRCRELATSDLDGIEDPARELAELAKGDRSLMERAYRMLRDAAEHEPRNAVLQQMLWFWRRAFEKGTWAWDQGAPDPHRYLS